MVGNGGALRQRLIGNQFGLRRGQGGAGLGQTGLRRLQRGFRVQDLFTADATGLGQLLAAADVALGSSQFGLRAQNVGTAQVDIGGQRVVLHVVSADLAHHPGQPGLSLL
ncbi:hypothetical protein D3C73_1363010 [compost metagenome]